MTISSAQHAIIFEDILFQLKLIPVDGDMYGVHVDVEDPWLMGKVISAAVTTMERICFQMER